MYCSFDDPTGASCICTFLFTIYFIKTPNKDTVILIEIDFLQSQNESSTAMLFQSIFYGFWSLMMVFYACELGQRFSNAFGEIDDKFGQLKSYLLPKDVQKMLPLIQIYAQQSIAVEFFGSMSLSREQFPKVRRMITEKLQATYFVEVRSVFFTGGRCRI